MPDIWDERYGQEDYYFGTEPNTFLLSQQHLLKPGMSCLAVADGEGRNGVWLAQQHVRADRPGGAQERIGFTKIN